MVLQLKFKLLDMSKPNCATVEVISDSIAEYLCVTSFTLASLAGASCHGALVMLRQEKGAMLL